MSQLPLFEPPSWTVSDLTHYLRQLLENDFRLQDVWVLGEVSNFSRPSSGHVYFTLKDPTAALRCVMWRTAAMRQAFIPREGDAVEVHGAISIYETTGVYQLYVDAIRPTGEGLLYQEFLRLKARLEAEGLFEPQRKRPIPRWPARIGIVTSPTGAALRDMINILRRRFPLAEVVLCPTQVQGDEAPRGIIQALRDINRYARPDVILLARGGGSIEDLWAFNDELVARAIVSSAAPVICGVGHETDFTIADFAADLRAPTPTAAAELATPNREDLQADLVDLTDRLERSARAALVTPAWQMKDLQRHLKMASPLSRLRTYQQKLDDVRHRLETSELHNLQIQAMKIGAIESRLSALNPQAVIARGYAKVTHLDGSIVSRVGQVRPGDELDVQVSDGKFGVRVKNGKDK